MSTPSRFTRIKITAGYLLLLAVLFFSLMFIHREIENLSVLDTEEVLKSDSLLILLRQKDENTINMLRTLNEANEKLLSVDELEVLLAQQDTIITQQRVQHRVVTKRDSIITPAPKKGFFRRLGEAFAPPKDTALLVNTTLELTTDTLLQEYNPADSLQQRIRELSKLKRDSHRTAVQRNNARLRRMNEMLTARIDSLIKGYEEQVVFHASRDAENQQEIRKRSTLTIGGVAIGAILLSAIFLIIIWRDITRSNRYRKELEIANRRAEELLQARENLMLTITHDFKAPLGSIIGYVDLLSGLVTDERQKFYLDNMKSSSDHLLKLVSDLLDFHRLDLNKAEINRVNFNPLQLFDAIKVSFEPLIKGKGLELQYHIDAELNGHYISDPLRIRQIVNNLLSNAVKFTSQGVVTLSIQYKPSHLIIAVADTGKGMEGQDRERIFQEFTRLPGAQGEEGFGLGLSIVRKLVYLLEGDIEVDSIPSKGSTFTVHLPLYPVAGEEVESKYAVEKDTALVHEVPPLRVLLIDDDKIQLNLTTAMLEKAGIPSVSCEQVDELIGQLRTETFNVLLTDVQMPAINGFDLLKLLRASNIPQARTIPVIAVTARSEMKEGEFLSHGFAGYLNKPFSVNDLLKVICGNAGNISPCEETLQEKEGLDFSTLNAFSGDDEESARAIVESFIVETGKNANLMQQALNNEDVQQIAAIAHKLIPLFTLIGANETVALLNWLESQRDAQFTSLTREKTQKVLILIADVIKKVRLEG